ncbi:MAG: uracil-DNA glycosylase [Sphingomicrobium sp.]
MGGDSDRIGSAEAASTLGWWIEAGVDAAVSETPRNWLASKPAPAPVSASATHSSAARPASPVAPASPAAFAPAAIPLPDSDTLDLFRDWLERAPTLPLGGPGAKRVLPHGAEAAPVMLIAEMPTGEDSAAGRPIAGAAWQLMERMLAAIGIDSGDAYSASLSCFHSPGARLSPDELDACAAIARRHIAAAKPQRLLLLGDAPARALLGKPLTAARGHVHKIEGIRAVTTFHPRFLMNRPSDKALAWRDLLLLMEEDA